MACAVVTACLLLLSTTTLYDLGYLYLSEAAPAAVKIHPATYAAAVLLVVTALQRGTIVGQLDRWFREVPDLVVYLGLCVVVFLYGQLVLGTAASHIADTFVAPGLVLLLFRDLRGTSVVRLRRVVDVVFAANAVIAIAEYVTQHMLTTPLVTIFFGAEADTSWRSQALFGHPLTNGLLIAVYLALSIAPRASFPMDLPRLGLVALNLMALPCFGARVSLVVALGMVGLLVAGRVWRLARGEGVAILALAGAAAVACIGTGLLFAAAQSGILDPLLERYLDDQGSGMTRLVALDQVAATSWTGLLFGDIAREQAQLNAFFGNAVGIEISWLAILLTYGLPMTGLLLAATALLVRRMMLDCGTRVLWAAGAFLAIDLSAMGIGAKGTALSVLVMLCYLFSDPFRPAARSAAPSSTGWLEPYRPVLGG